mmetsp:Transcript_121229/g.387335  ORF Transcript_121229/g.387335 Transcript_121229/m.387335 type:complete len:218 (-) Transcript_121229:1097-1750(-)
MSGPCLLNSRPGRSGPGVRGSCQDADKIAKPEATASKVRRGPASPGSPRRGGSPGAAAAIRVSSPVLRRPEFQDFCWDLGVSPAIHGQAADSVEMVAVRHMFAAPLPPEWSQHQDPRTGHSYFFDCLRGASSWKHPQDALFRDVLAEVQAWQSADTDESILGSAFRAPRLRAGHVGLCADAFASARAPQCLLPHSDSDEELCSLCTSPQTPTSTQMI